MAASPAGTKIQPTRACGRMTDSNVLTKRTDLLREVRKADPEWDRDSKRPIAYRFSNKREFIEKEGSSYEDA